MNKKEVLSRINEVILEEKGTIVTIDSMFTDAQLDSLGTAISLITIDSEFEIFDPDKAEKDLSDLGIPELTIRELVEKCVSSITNTSTGQKTVETT